MDGRHNLSQACLKHVNPLKLYQLTQTNSIEHKIREHT